MNELCRRRRSEGYEAHVDDGKQSARPTLSVSAHSFSGRSPHPLPTKGVTYLEHKEQHLQELMEKRIALGHKPDDHVDEQDYNLQY